MKDDFYKSVIKEAPIGYAFYKIICDEKGIPCDYEFIEMNSAFESFTGLRGIDTVGKRMTEISPKTIGTGVDSIKTYGAIAMNGGSKEIEEFSKIMQKWYRIKIYSPEKYYFITYITDVSKEIAQIIELENLKETVQDVNLSDRTIVEYDWNLWEGKVNASEQKYKILFENAVESILVIQNTKIQICNPMLQKLTGYSEKKLMSMSFLDLLYIEDKERALNNHNTRLKEKKYNVKQIYRLERKDKAIRWIEVDGIQINWNGKAAILNFIVDITEHKLAEDALKMSEEKYRLLTEYASDVIWVLNLTKHRFTYISPSMFYLRGYTSEEAMNESLEESLTPESAVIVKKAIEGHIKYFIENPEDPQNYINQIQQPCKNGDIIWVEASTKYRYNSEGDIEIVGVSRNIEQRKKSEREVLYLSYHDQLTGLYNRRFYEEEIERVDTEGNLPITLVMADVNGLKLTNDAFGHLVGDKILKDFAMILKKEAREDDSIARTGGDEFVLLLPNTDSKQAEKIVSRIKSSIMKEKTDKTILSVSFGWATKKNREEKFDEIYTQAEDYMYRKKLMESTSMKSETIKLITKSLHEKNAIEQQHCERVSEHCRQIGIAMDLSSDVVDELGLLGLFHDIGKIGVNENISNKSEELKKNEWVEIKRHPEIGYQILRSVNEFAHIAEYVLSHHERLDGTGYPRNLKEDQIQLQAKILSVAEAYDAMTNEYPYKVVLSESQAIEELKVNSDTQFDAEIVKIFVEKVLGRKLD